MDLGGETQLLERAIAGEAGALSELLALHEPRLERLIDLRMEPNLRRRVDPADVVQDALLEATRRFSEFRASASYPFPVWLRLVAAQELARVHRVHLKAQMRDAFREVPLEGSRPSLSSARCAEAFVASATSPSHAAHRDELCARVRLALDELEEIDREIVVLRHFEELSNEEAALELAIEPAAASKRFVRALQRLRSALTPIAPGASGPAA